MTDDILDLAFAALRREAAALEPPEPLRPAVLARLEARETDDGGGLEPDAPDTAEEVLAGAHVEAVEAADLSGLTGAVLARLDETPATEEDGLALAPDLEPDLGGQPVGDWLRAEAPPPPDTWSAFTEGVLARLDDAPAAASRDLLGAGDDARRAGVPVGELLREAHARELERMDGRWSAFAAQIQDQLEAPSPEGDLEAQAVALLRADVDDELRELAPAFEEAFKEEVDRRIFVRGRSPKPWLDRLRSWVRERSAAARAGWGLGLAAAAAAAALVVVPRGGPRPDPMAGARAELRGEVSVDAVSFEGDVMMIPDDGVTVMVLSDV
jgi:hypothetical protein